MVMVEPERKLQEGFVATVDSCNIRNRVGINSVYAARQTACVLKAFELFNLCERILIERRRQGDQCSVAPGLLRLRCNHYPLLWG